MINSIENWLRPDLSKNDAIKSSVAEMLAEIKSGGSAAIRTYSQKFDRFTPEVIELKAFDAYELPAELAQSIKTAASRIERFARAQRESVKDVSFTDEYGEYGHKLLPIDRIAAYIPGGRFPLISTALMTLIPARIAGCNERIAFSPSTNPALLAAASLAGATQFVKLGGAQAIAAAAFGSEWNPAVSMIIGPGNAYVAEAKAQLQTQVSIDTVAGPSEVLILADKKQPIEWLAEDAIAQAEHGSDALAIIVSDDITWLTQMETFLTSTEAGRELIEGKQIQLLISSGTPQTIHFANDFAAEHLMICDDRIAAQDLSNAGAIFIGANSPVALGDYLSGPNHTLPTSASAKRSSGLSVMSFLRMQTWQAIRQENTLYHLAASLADAEGLTHHAKSLRLRKPS